MPKKKDEWEAEEAWSPEEDPWYQRAQQSAEALLDRPAFSYDPGADPLWQSTKELYRREGRRAMEDTLGRAAALSGGYASSYAQTLGGQAYDEKLTRLAELLPDYYDRARRSYDSETGALRDELSTALGLYDKDYQAWLDRENARTRAAEAADKQARWEAEFNLDKEQWDRDFAEDHARWEAEFAQAAEKWAAQQAAADADQAHSDAANERSYAYRMAMLALQRGLRVSDALLQAAGIDPAYAETIRRYFASQH